MSKFYVHYAAAAAAGGNLLPNSVMVIGVSLSKPHTSVRFRTVNHLLFKMENNGNFILLDQACPLML